MLTSPRCGAKTRWGNPYSQTEEALPDACRRWAYEVHVEQEPGSGGKESVENTIRKLAGSPCSPTRYGSKEVRAEPFAAQMQGGNV
jgi:phage terminase large subunit-like protein